MPKGKSMIKWSYSYITHNLCNCSLLASSGSRLSWAITRIQSICLHAVVILLNGLRPSQIKNKTAKTVAMELFKLQCQKGAASIFIHDQGTEFVNQVNQELCSMMGISKRMSTAHHPMINGKMLNWINAGIRLSRQPSERLSIQTHRMTEILTWNPLC